MKLLLTFFTLFLVSIYGSKLPGLKVPNDVVQHYGYIPVNDQYNANLFYWMFEAQNKSNDFVLWLNGGPGFVFFFLFFKRKLLKNFSLKT